MIQLDQYPYISKALNDGTDNDVDAILDVLSKIIEQNGHNGWVRLEQVQNSGDMSSLLKILVELHSKKIIACAGDFKKLLAVYKPENSIYNKIVKRVEVKVVQSELEYKKVQKEIEKTALIAQKNNLAQTAKLLSTVEKARLSSKKLPDLKFKDNIPGIKLKDDD